MKKFTINVNGWWLVCLGAFAAGALLAFDLFDTDKAKQFIKTPSLIDSSAQGYLMNVMAPYCEDEPSTTLTYTCWSSTTSTQVIMKTEVIGGTNTFNTKASGTWANRASLTYTGIND